MPPEFPLPGTPHGATRAGYVALVGFPNAGKSSLMNQLLEQKLSIVTSAAQTTRERVLGIDTRGEAQMIFVDTPGLVEPRYLLHRSMLNAALEAVPDADIVLVLIDPTTAVPGFGPQVLELLNRRPASARVVVTKVDIASREQVEQVRRWTEEHLPVPVLEVSSATGAGMERLREEIASLLPPSPFLYPEDEISSQPVRFFVSELIRETVFELYQKEIPYSVAARVEEYREAEDPVYIRATIFVERPTQKGILIGRGGAAIKELGRAAREKIEAFVGAAVYLDLWVKVLPRWRKDPVVLQRLGYTLPKEERS